MKIPRLIQRVTQKPIRHINGNGWQANSLVYTTEGIFSLTTYKFGKEVKTQASKVENLESGGMRIVNTPVKYRSYPNQPAKRKTVQSLHQFGMRCLISNLYANGKA